MCQNSGGCLASLAMSWLSRFDGGGARHSQGLPSIAPNLVFVGHAQTASTIPDGCGWRAPQAHGLSCDVPVVEIRQVVCQTGHTSSRSRSSSPNMDLLAVTRRRDLFIDPTADIAATGGQAPLSTAWQTNHEPTANRADKGSRPPRHSSYRLALLR